MIQKTFDLTGILQGVGLRPAIKRLALRFHLRGWVQNRSGTVRMCLIGPEETIDAAMQALPESLPRQARLDHMEPIASGEPVFPAEEFQIIASESDATARVMIPVDLAICPSCQKEIFDPDDRRYGYAFTTCTDCGPRYTVVTGMPYDREKTTLAPFPLCPECEAEYTHLDDRRFHAESTACPHCGPTVWLCDARGTPLPGNPIPQARALLAAGQIVAVRGLGGFHLAADATNAKAIQNLRQRKQRPHKPLAVMMPDLTSLKQWVDVNATTLTMLTSARAPIVICDPTPRGKTRFPLETLSPDTGQLGVMLPTTPLHHLLFQPLPGDPTPPFDALIMTSGNASGEPICITNEQALSQLHHLADAFLLHDREIQLRCDDSLCAPMAGQGQVWRRARGYAPEAIPLTTPLNRAVLAMGSILKNTLAMGRDRELTLSPHIGDLTGLGCVQAMETMCEQLPRFLGFEPEVLAVDLHPDAPSSRLGEQLAAQWNLPLIRVQHHVAHAWSCFAEHGVSQGLALVFDGVGWGEDETTWGAELLAISPGQHTRWAHFQPVPLPGGDAAVTHPIRQLVARLHVTGEAPDEDAWRSMGVDPRLAELWIRQCDTGLNAPLTSAAGRLFDAVAAALNLAPDPTTHEGQAPMRLEACARLANEPADICAFDLVSREDRLIVDWSPWFRTWLHSPPRPEAHPSWALAFHRAVARAGCHMAEFGRQHTGWNTVALSGGVMMNRVLCQFLVPMLEARGFRVLIHRHIPPNDGGIAAGQCLAAGLL